MSVPAWLSAHLGRQLERDPLWPYRPPPELIYGQRAISKQAELVIMTGTMGSALTEVLRRAQSLGFPYSMALGVRLAALQTVAPSFLDESLTLTDGSFLVWLRRQEVLSGCA